METKNENPTPFIATHPGSVLKVELNNRGILQKDFATKLGMQKSHFNEIIRGKRPVTQVIAEKLEKELGIPAIFWLNMQTQYEYDSRRIEERSTEEQAAIDMLRQYDEFFDVNVALKRIGALANTGIEKLKCLVDAFRLSDPNSLKLETEGLFKKSSKTGLDVRMLMTWKLLAEAAVKNVKPIGVFDSSKEKELVNELKEAFHENKNTIDKIGHIFSKYGIAFCVVAKVEKASVDGYSFMDGNTPCLIVTKRFDRIDNLAFTVMHESGHIFLHYIKGKLNGHRLEIAEYDNESLEEKEANVYASNALVCDFIWKQTPKVRVNPFVIQREYMKWAKERGLNKWIVLGRISYETGMYKFKNDESRKIG